MDAPAEQRIPFSYDDMFASGSPAVSGSRGEALTAELTGRLADDLAAVSIREPIAPRGLRRSGCSAPGLRRTVEPVPSGSQPISPASALTGGHVALLQPLSTKMLTWFMAAAAVSLCTFLLRGSTRKEIASGYLAR